MGIAEIGQKVLIPSFFIIGPPRTGTSWLHEVLKQRTALPNYMKETRFFDVHFDRGMRWYQAHFVTSSWPTVGEIAPTYFASTEACLRIRDLIPNAKIVCIFRHPVERIVSLYRVKRAYGIIPWSFEEALRRDPELMESSKYASHLRQWLRTFGSEQVLPTFYDDLMDDRQAYVDAIADFIGLPRFMLREVELRSIHASERLTHPRNYILTNRATLMADWLKAWGFERLVAAVNGSPVKKLFLGGGPAFSQPSPETLRMLYAVMQHEVAELEEIVSRDLSAWNRLSIPSNGRNRARQKAAA